MSPVRRAYVWSRHSLYSSSYNSSYVYFPFHVYHGLISTKAYFIALFMICPASLFIINQLMELYRLFRSFIPSWQTTFSNKWFFSHFHLPQASFAIAEKRSCGKSTFGPQTSAVILPSSSVISTKRGHNDQCFDGRSHPVLALSENNNHYDVCPNRIISSSLSDGPRPGMPSQGREQ